MKNHSGLIVPRQKFNISESLAYSIEIKAKEIFLASHPELNFMLSGIIFPKDTSVYPVFNYAGISKPLSYDTLSFLSGLIETSYEEARAVLGSVMR